MERMRGKEGKGKPWKEQVARVQDIEHYLKVFKQSSVGRMRRIEEKLGSACDRLLDMEKLSSENSRRIAQLEVGGLSADIERQQAEADL